MVQPSPIFGAAVTDDMIKINCDIHQILAKNTVLFNSFSRDGGCVAGCWRKYRSRWTYTLTTSVAGADAGGDRDPDIDNIPSLGGV